MGQLGFQELLLIFVVALLVFGPKKLPELGKSLGKGLKEFKRATNDIKSSWEEQVRDVEKDLTDTTKDLKDLEKDLKKDLDKDPKADFYASQGPSPQSSTSENSSQSEKPS